MISYDASILVLLSRLSTVIVYKLIVYMIVYKIVYKTERTDRVSNGNHWSNVTGAHNSAAIVIFVYCTEL